MVSYFPQLIRSECWLNIYSLFGLELVSSSISIRGQNNTIPSLFTGLHNLYCLQSANEVSPLKAFPTEKSRAASILTVDQTTFHLKMPNNS